MLVLSRKKNEAIFVGDGPLLRIIIVDIKQDHKGTLTVRLGFEAPPELAVDREEIWLNKQREKDNPTS